MKILVLNGSTTGTTKQFATLMIQKRFQALEQPTITEIDLNTTMGASLNAKTLATFYNESQQLIEMIQGFDEVMILSGMINFNMAPVVKSFLDKLAVARVTFAYNAKGAYSPMRGMWKPKVTILMTSGTMKKRLPKVARQVPQLIVEQLHHVGFEYEQITVKWASGVSIPALKGKTIEEKFAFFRKDLLD